jgi:hypothetical protein
MFVSQHEGDEMNAPNFTAVAAAFQAIRDDLEDALQDAQVEVRLADRELADAELAADLRTWTYEERSRWECAHLRVRAAYDNLRKIKEAL